MNNSCEIIQNCFFSENTIIFISGVPGVGKTTISYELLKKYNIFRLIQETDLIREILRGYNDFLNSRLDHQYNKLFGEIEITDHTKLLTFQEAKIQCLNMKNSIEHIVARQQRKSIATIFNGVHIIPEILHGIGEDDNIIFINLYVTDEKEIFRRIMGRNPTSYMLDNISLIYQTNQDLYLSTEKLAENCSNVFNVDVTNLDIENTVIKIIYCINKFYNNNLIIL